MQVSPVCAPHPGGDLQPLLLLKASLNSHTALLTSFALEYPLLGHLLVVNILDSAVWLDAAES